MAAAPSWPLQAPCAAGEKAVVAGCVGCAAGTYSTNGFVTTCARCPAGRVAGGGMCFGDVDASIRGDDWDEGNVNALGSSCYYVSPGRDTWDRGRRHCERLGGHLATISGSAENDFVARAVARVHGAAGYWVGLQERKRNAHAWEWSDPMVCSGFRRWDKRHKKATKRCARSEGTRANGTAAFESAKCGTANVYVCEAPVRHAATTCLACPEGTYARSPTKCASCQWGRYASSVGSAECDRCPAWSSAALQSRWFQGPRIHAATRGGSVRCGGGLGRRQRRAYNIAVVVACCFPLLYVGLLYACWRFERACAAAFRCRPLVSLAAIRRDEWCLGMIIYGGLVAVGCATAAPASLAKWLAPLVSPVDGAGFGTGRRTATSKARGCDPGQVDAYFLMGVIGAAVAGQFLLAVAPIWPADLDGRRRVFGAYDRLRGRRLRRRLQLQLRETVASWERSRLHLEEDDEGGAATTPPTDAPPALATIAWACTLCHAERASALNMPCAHQLMCIPCAEAFRAECGEICSCCREPSDLIDAVRRDRHSKASMGRINDGGEGRAPVVPPGRRRRRRAPPQRVTEADHTLFARLRRVDSDGTLLDRMTTMELGALVRDGQAGRDVAVENDRARALNRLARVCASCAEATMLVVDTPCGHSTLCEPCARQFRADAGAVCSRCSKASEVARPIAALTCSVCCDEVGATAGDDGDPRLLHTTTTNKKKNDGRRLVTLGVCGHTICTHCSVRFVRSSLADVGREFTGHGIKCPLRPTGCEGVVTLATIRRLVALPHDPDEEYSVYPITDLEYARVERLITEAAIPDENRFYCAYPSCARVFDVADERKKAAAALLFATAAKRKRTRKKTTTPHRRRRTPTDNADADDHDPPPRAASWTTLGALATRLRPPFFFFFFFSYRVSPDGGEEDPQQGDDAGETTEAPPSPVLVRCPNCARKSCLACRTANHAPLTCAQVQSSRRGDDPLVATEALVKATTKDCPKCGIGVSHFHGHACHHIKPRTGCLNCGTHFCYACGRAGYPGRSCRCKLFCKMDNLALNIVLTPFPVDQRCGCPICPECRYKDPCAQCDGGCAVCRGNVPFAPSSLVDVENWWPERAHRRRGVEECKVHPMTPA